MTEPKKFIRKHWVEWRLDGKLHRVDAPARVWNNGDKYWYQHGEHHREDGPAIEFANGDKIWFLNGIRYNTEEEWFKEIVRRWSVS